MQASSARLRGRVARQAGFMVDTQPCGQAGDFMVDGFAGLAAAVVGVVHQRHAVVLDADAQRIRHRHTAFGKRKTKPHHHAGAAVDNHGYFGFKRLAVDRVLHLGFKAVAVADPHIIRPYTIERQSVLQQPAVIRFKFHPHQVGHHF